MSREKRPPLVDVGHSKQKQHNSGAKRHVVVKVESGWTLLCTGTPATREYSGWLTAKVVQCKSCLNKAQEATHAA